MNLINYNQVIEALDKERQFLLNREQYGAENVLVHHAINVIAELSIIRQPEIIRCKDCRYGQCCTDGETTYQCFKWNSGEFGILHEQNWFCADGEKLIRKE